MSSLFVARICAAYIPAFNKNLGFKNITRNSFEIIGSAHNVSELKIKEKQGCSNIFLSQFGRILVVNVMGRLFMESLDDPFAAIERVLSDNQLGDNCDAIIIDIHAETTSEKTAMGHFCDGRVSLVVGTHTHIPTADHQILPFGTAYQTDAGMCGDYDSVIGMEKTEPIRRFVEKTPGGRFNPAQGIPTLCGLIIETSVDGLSESIEPFRVGGILSQTDN